MLDVDHLFKFFLLNYSNGVRRAQTVLGTEGARHRHRDWNLSSPRQNVFLWFKIIDCSLFGAFWRTTSCEDKMHRENPRKDFWSCIASSVTFNVKPPFPGNVQSLTELWHPQHSSSATAHAARDISRISPRIDRIFFGEALNPFFGAQDEGFSEFRSR